MLWQASCNSKRRALVSRLLANSGKKDFSNLSLRETYEAGDCALFRRRFRDMDELGLNAVNAASIMRQKA